MSFFIDIFSTEGRRYDAGMFADLGLLKDLSQYAFILEGTLSVCMETLPTL